MSKDKYIKYALKMFDVLSVFIPVYIDLNIKDIVETYPYAHSILMHSIHVYLWLILFSTLITFQILMNAASAMVAVTMGVLIQWGAMSASVHLERNCTGIKRTALVSVGD